MAAIISRTALLPPVFRANFYRRRGPRITACGTLTVIRAPAQARGHSTAKELNMDYFAIVSFDVAESSDGRKKAVGEHRARLEELDQAGRLLTAGPLPRVDAYGKVVDGFQGSIIIAAFESLEEARQWAKVDPYNAEGVYMETTVYPYKKVF